MNNLSRVSAIAIPSILGMGFAWVGVRLLRNERKLAERKMELELQLDTKALISK